MTEAAPPVVPVAEPTPNPFDGVNITELIANVSALSSDNDIDQGHTAWIMVSTALVFIMIPGVGYFYSGMARSKNALSLIMLSVLSLAVVTIQVFFFSKKKNDFFLCESFCFNLLFLKKIFSF